MRRLSNKMICFLVIAGLGIVGPAAAEVIDRIVAIVDSEIITLSQLKKESDLYRKGIETANQPPEAKQELLKTLDQKILERMIDESLARQEAVKYRIEVSETDVDGAIDNIRKMKTLSREALERIVQQEGLTLEEYRETIRKQILQSRLINQTVNARVVVTEADIRQYYDTHADTYQTSQKFHLRNILVHDERQAREIKTRLDQGEDFSTLARTYSVAGNASDAGDLGIFDSHSLSDTIRDAVAGLDKRDYTEVIPTAQGFQIFYVEDILAESHQSFEQVRDAIHERLYRERVEEKFDTWLNALKQRAYIKILL